MRKPPKEVKLTSYDELLGIEQGENVSKDFKIISAPLSELFAPKDHPFRVLDDEKMEETTESIRNYGVLNPGIARPRSEGGYELISGNRRKRGCERANISEMPVILRNLTDDEATIIMVDSNIQREDLLYSEKAFAYRLKFEAMKHQGSKTGKVTTAQIGEKGGESGRTVQRYIRLTYLSTELLDMVDAKKIKFIPAEKLSYLKENEQEWLLGIIRENGTYPSDVQAGKLKEYSEKGELTKAVIELLMQSDKPEPKKVVLNTDKINHYFPETYSKQDIEKVIYELLEDWKKKQ